MMSNKLQRGFTMTELMLAVSFIAILLLAIAMLIIQMSAIYNKGLTLREANQAGQFISSEIQRTLNQTYSNAVAYVELPEAQGGRLCAGGTVYAWNYPGANGGGLQRVNAINQVGTPPSANVRFVKFTGSADTYCQAASGWKELPPAASELLSGGNANIAIHSFNLEKSTVTEDGTQTIYAVKMIIGTPHVGLIEEGNSLRCKAGDKKDDEWCAVNEFNFTARSGNREVLQ